MSEPREQDPALVGATVTVGILKRDQVGRIGNEKFSIAPREPHRKDELLGEDVRFLKLPVRIAIFENTDAAFARELF